MEGKCREEISPKKKEYHSALFEGRPHFQVDQNKRLRKIFAHMKNEVTGSFTMLHNTEFLKYKCYLVLLGQ
jgi:hypothetical protein